MAEAPSATTDRLTTDYDRLRDECGIIEQAPIALIEVSGEDRKGWLQGQATNDVRQLDLGASTRFCFCEPTGQIIAVCSIWSLKDRFIISCPLAAREGVLHRVESMVVMEDVVARDVSPEFELISIQGPGTSSVLGNLVTLPLLDAGETELNDAQIMLLRSDRTGSGGWDVLVPSDAKKAQTNIRKAFDPVCLEAYFVARLEAGVPLHGTDYSSKTMPPELGPAFEAAYVDYRKGCYTGQEVLMRIHSRGHTNRTWVGLRADEPLTVGTPILNGNKEAGYVTSAAYSPDFGQIGAAMVRNEIAQEREMVDVGGIQAEVQRLPFLRLE